MTVQDIRVGAWSLRATAGTVAPIETIWLDEDGNDDDLGADEVTVWVGGTVTDPTDLTEADGYVGVNAANVATHQVTIPDGTDDVPLRIVRDGTLIAIGVLYPSLAGTADPDTSVTIQPVPLSLTIQVVAGGVGGGGGGGLASVTSSDSATIDFSGAGTAGSPLTGSVKDASITAAKVAADVATQAELDAVAATIPTTEVSQDLVGAMFSGNTETGIAASYDDTNGKIDLVAEVTQAELDALSGTYVPQPAGAPTAGQILSATDDDPLTTDWIDPPSATLVRRDIAGTTHTFELTDAEKIVRATAAGASTFTVPPDADEDFADDTVIHCYAAGAGGLTIAEGAGVTIRNNFVALEQYNECSLRKDGADEWVRAG